MNTSTIIRATLLAAIVGCSIMAAIISGTAWILGREYLTLKETEMKNQARYECALSSRVEVKESDKVIGSYPSEKGYQKCLEEKGL